MLPTTFYGNQKQPLILGGTVSHVFSGSTVSCCNRRTEVNFSQSIHPKDVMFADVSFWLFFSVKRSMVFLFGVIVFWGWRLYY